MIRYTRDELYSFYKPDLPVPANFQEIPQFTGEPIPPSFIAGTRLAVKAKDGGRKPARTKEEVKAMNVTRFQDSKPREAATVAATPQSAVAWYYLDPQSKVHGPYDSVKMRGWYDKFPPDVKISVNGTDRDSFRLMSEVFPEPAMAFMFNPVLFPFYGARVTDEDEPLEKIFLDYEATLA